LTEVPLPFAHRLVQLLERHRDGISEVQADEQIAAVLRKARLSARIVDRIIEGYRAQPPYIQRAIAGSAYESPLGNSTLDQMLAASYAESIVARESRLAVANVRLNQRLLRAEIHALQGEVAGGPGGRDAADETLEDLPKKVPTGTTVIDKNGTLAAAELTEDGVVVTPPEPSPEDPAKRVAWIVNSGTCNEPVFGTDYVMGVGRFRDGRGREGIRMVKRASGLPYRFDEDDTVNIRKSVYGPADPNGYLEIDVDFVELDSPDDILAALDALANAAVSLGMLLQNPVVSLAGALGSVIKAIIEAVVDKDGTDLGNIATIYLTEQQIDAKTGVEETEKLDRMQRIGYDWDYDFQYVLAKVGA
jgi:hypothetical protein